MKPAIFAKQCQDNLFGSESDCKNALKYLVEERGLLVEFVKQAELGFCRKRQEVPGEDTWELKDPKDRIGLENKKMKGRIIVPVKTEFGKIVGFGARSPDPKEGGWWNTKFDKYNNMFLFDVSRKNMFSEDKVYLVEGYMDALVLKQEGLSNVCSVMGTALGYRRIGLIKRYCNDVCICFDSDANEAGQRARDKSVYELSVFNFGRISTIDLPVKVDPDDFVIKNGLNELLELERDLTKKEIKEAVARHLTYTKSIKA